MPVAFGKYQLIKRLAVGGMGELFLAHAPGANGFHKRVVIKRILPHLAQNQHFLELFLDEARIASRLDHPNIAHIFELGQVDGRWYLAMEFVEGHDLRELLRRVYPRGIPLEFVCRIISDAAAGLHHAHKAIDPHGLPLEIVHRDVSPHNVLVGLEGSVKLIDFGVAKAAGRLQHTATGQLRGKFAYMAPEQAEEGKVDGRADIFALGILMWECLTGRRLFKGATEAITLRQVTECKVIAPSELVPGLPRTLDAVCLKALSKRPEDRYATAEALRLEIEDFIVRKQLLASAAHLTVWLQELFCGEPPSDEANAFYTSSVMTGFEADPVEELLDEAVFEPQLPETRENFATLLSPGLPLPPNNLSHPPGRFIGRAQDLEHLGQLWAQGHRMVTLLGPGGTGKTRLATHFALERLRDSGPGGAWFCDLTEARDTEALCATLARTLSIPLSIGTDAAIELGKALGRRGPMLLVLDNFEQLVAHSAGCVGAWLEGAPQLRLWVTSREALGVKGESVYPVPPLSVPTSDQEASEAVELFIDRARSFRTSYEPSEPDRAAIAEIVRQLDGMPLAIELAAARIEVLSPAQLLERLPRRFELLTGKRDATARQSTLRGAIDWSWQLLTPFEQAALAQCSVFRAGFSLEAAEAVLDLSAWPEAPWPLDVVQTLKAKSLVRSYEQPAGMRFGLYDSIREFALEKLRATGTEEQIRARHARHYLEQGLRLAEGFDGPKGVAVLDALALERENLFAVFQSSVAGTGVVAAQRALQAVEALDPLLSVRGPFQTHLSMLDLALERSAREDVSPELKLRALRDRGRARQARGRIAESLADFDQATELARELGDVKTEGGLLSDAATAHRLMGQADKARIRYEAALELLRETGDRRMEGRVLGYLGGLAQEQSAVVRARDFYEKALAIHQEVGDRRFEGIALGNLGSVSSEMHRVRDAVDCYEKALAIHREVGNRRSEGIVLNNLGGLHRDLGKREEAEGYYVRALAIHREVNNPRFEAIALAHLGGMEHELGRLREAQAQYVRALGLFREVKDKRYEALCLACLGAVHAAAGRLEQSARTLDEAETLLEGLKDRGVSTAIALYRAHLDAALAKQAEAQGESALAKRFRAKAQERISFAEQKGPPTLDQPEGTASAAEASGRVRDALRSLRLLFELD